MTRYLLVRTLKAAALFAVVVMASLVTNQRTAQAQDYCGPSSRPDLFYNYYVPPVACPCTGGAVGAAMYPCPRPTPPLVGQTYITYQPLDPHEFLYRHHRTYYRDNGPYAGVTRTHVCWW
jgi:hypothetical protein